MRLSAYILALALSVSTLEGTPPPQKQGSTQKKIPTPNAKPKVNYFGFGVIIVEEGDFLRYRIEGVSIDGWRFVLSCPETPPVEFAKGHSAREMVEEYEKFKNIVQYKEIALRSALASIDQPRTPQKYGSMTLYTLEVPPVVVTHCWLVNQIENGGDVFGVTVSSSGFRNWKDGTGYEITARTSDESLTLGCTEGKGIPCRSLPPGAYRAIRINSSVRMYDKDLNFLGSYRILSEGPASP